MRFEVKSSSKTHRTLIIPIKVRLFFLGVFNPLQTVDSLRE